jgi:hypothetical protein
MPATAITHSAMPARITCLTRRLTAPLPESTLVHQCLHRPIIAPTSLWMFTQGVVCKWYPHMSTRFRRCQAHGLSPGPET